MVKLKTTDNLMAEAIIVCRNNSTENLITTEEIIKIIRTFLYKERDSAEKRNIVTIREGHQNDDV